MNTAQIAHAPEQDPKTSKKFCGVFPSDELPQTIDKYLNIAKTEFMIIGSRQRINASQDNIDIRIDDREVTWVHSTKSLGLHIDSNLTWSVRESM